MSFKLAFATLSLNNLKIKSLEQKCFYSFKTALIKTINDI